MLKITVGFRTCVVALLFSAVSATGAAALPAPFLFQVNAGAGHCLAFDGLDDFVGVPRSLSLEPAEITVELWARLDGPQDWNSRLLRKGEDDAYFITADQDHDQQMQFLFNQQHAIVLQVKDPQPHTAYIGTWHHFAGVYATDHAQFWVDGIMVASRAHDIGALTHQPLTDLCIGAGLPVPLQNEYFAGRIDEVRIWNYPRTAAEIQATWNLSASGNEPGLVACWHFDEAGGQVANDASASGNNGQLGVSPGPESSDPTWQISDAPIGPFSCQTERYCASLPNSTGAAAIIDVSGSLSVSANDMHLLASGCPPGKRGLFLYGGTRVQYPFGDGYLCISPISPGLFRIPAPQTIDPAGQVDLSVDFTSLPAQGAIIAGSTWNFQFWFRDPLPAGSGFNLSDAIGASFCP